MSFDPGTLAYYQAHAPRYVHSTSQSHSRHLDRFLDRLSAGAPILELGCGGGRDAARMVRRGFDVDATDGAPAMVAKARERHGIAARAMRFDELAAHEAYDAVWANACLLHVSRDALPDVLAAIHRALKPGGWHGASYKLGDGEGRDALGRLHNFPDWDWLEGSYVEAGLRVHERLPFVAKGSDGVRRDWCTLMMQKAA